MIVIAEENLLVELSSNPKLGYLFFTSHALGEKSMNLLVGNQSKRKKNSLKFAAMMLATPPL